MDFVMLFLFLENMSYICKNYSKTVEKKVEIINSYQNIRAYKNKQWDLNIGHL